MATKTCPCCGKTFQQHHNVSNQTVQITSDTVIGPNDFLEQIRLEGIFELICDLMQAYATDWVSQIPDQTLHK